MKYFSYFLFFSMLPKCVSWNSYLLFNSDNVRICFLNMKIKKIFFLYPNIFLHVHIKRNSFEAIYPQASNQQLIPYILWTMHVWNYNMKRILPGVTCLNIHPFCGETNRIDHCIKKKINVLIVYVYTKHTHTNIYNVYEDCVST